MKTFDGQTYLLLLLLVVMVMVIGFFCPLMVNDSNQFAVMAMRMVNENDYTTLIKDTEEYLDKPHMHYWLAALSYKLFGINQYAYRIPALLSLLLGVYSCYGIGKLLYNKQTGWIVSLVFITAQTIVLSAIDVRTDAVLTGFAIFSIWQLMSYMSNRKLVHIMLGAFGAGIAFSTKGQIALVVIGMCVLVQLTYTKKWKALFDWKVLVALVVFAITISPMLYAYYQQFDLHPEKVIRGKSNRSGIFFILWEQSFERLSGEGVGKNSSDYFFFFHTLLWTFLPWTIIMLTAFYSKVRYFIKTRFRFDPKEDLISLASFIILLLLISFAQFKLPHYLNVLIPLVAIVTGSFLYRLHEESKDKWLSVLLKAQYFVLGVVLIASALLLFTVFGIADWVILTIALLMLLMLLYFLRRLNSKVWKIVIVGVLSSVLLNLVMNGHFYPKLLQYQSGLQLAKMAEWQGIPKSDIFKAGTYHSWDVDFYNKRPTPYLEKDTIAQKLGEQDVWLFVDGVTRDSIANRFTIEKELKAENFHITRLSLRFLNPSSRASKLDYKYLVKVADSLQ